MDLNKAMIIGRLTRDPEVRTTPSGQTVANFSIATNRVWTDQSGAQQKKVEYHNIVAWRKLAEICAEYLKKGKQIYLEGHLQTRDWQGQDGVKRYRTEIIADQMIMLGSASDGQGGGAPSGPSSAQSTGGYGASAQPAPVAGASVSADNVPSASSDAGKMPTINVEPAAGGEKNAPNPTDKKSDEEVSIEDIPF